MQTKQIEFKVELKALLKKYNASIGFTCDASSDTYGITGEKLVADLRDDADSGRSIQVELSDGFGWWISAEDL